MNMGSNLESSLLYVGLLFIMFDCDFNK